MVSPTQAELLPKPLLAPLADQMEVELTHGSSLRLPWLSHTHESGGTSTPEARFAGREAGPATAPHAAEEGGLWGKHGFPHAHAAVSSIRNKPTTGIVAQSGRLRAS